MDPKRITKPVVLRRRSANYPGRGRRIHGIVFDHPSMPRIMAVSSVVRPFATNDRPGPHGADHGSPPALIHSPTTSMPRCRSPHDPGRLPVSDTSRQPSHAEGSPNYQQMWSSGQIPNYAPPSTSRSNTNTDARALPSEGTTMVDHSRPHFKHEKAMPRYPDPSSRNQNGPQEPTSVRDEVGRRVHFEQRQPMAPHASRGNPETVAYTRGNPEVVADHSYSRGNREAVAHTRGNPETVAHHTHPRGNLETVGHPRGNPEAVAHHTHPLGNPEPRAHPRGNPEPLAHPRGNPEPLAHPRGNPEAVTNHPHQRGTPETVAHARGNPETVAYHPGIVTQSMSHRPYFQTPPQYSPSFPNATQRRDARFCLAQHVTRRNSTGTLQHYPSSVNGGAAISEFEARYGEERQVDFSRQFHQNVLLESGDLGKIRLGYPPKEGHSPQGRHHVVMETAPPLRFVAPTSVTSTKKPSLVRQSSVPAGVSTFNAGQARRRATWDSHCVTEPIPDVPAAMAPVTGEKDPGFYRPPSQTSEIVTSRACTGATRESTQYTKERSGYKDTPEYTRGKSGYGDVLEYTKESWGAKDTLVQKKLESTKGRRLRKKESSTVVVISDSEGEEELADSDFFEASPSEDWEDSESDVFSVGDCGQPSPVAPVILLGGLITNRTNVKSEPLSGSEQTCWSSDSRDVDSRKGRHRSIVLEDENTKDPSEKKSVVLGERALLCTGVKSETNAKHCIDVSEKSFAEDIRVTNENTSRAVVNVRRSSSSHQCDFNNNDFNNNERNQNDGKIATDEDRNMGFSCREPVEPPVSVNAVRACEMAVHSKLGGNIRRPEKATREEYGCDSGRIAKCSRCKYHGCSSGRGNFDYTNKNPGDVSEKCAASPSRTCSSSPTFGLLTRQLSKLTDDEMQTEIKKGGCIGDARTRENTRGMENTRGRETREAKSPCGVCAEYHGNLQLNTKTETPGLEACDECNYRSCDFSAAKYECPGTKCKLSDVTSQKAVNKPTGIVVGVKKDRRVEEPLVSKTVDANGLEKHDGGKTKYGQETNDGSENAEKAAMRNERSRSFGVLQFSVVEKDVDANWRNGHECPKSHSGSSGATQQWQAYSVKLEKGSTRKQCDVSDRNEVLGETIKEKIHRRDASEPSVLKDMRQEEILRNLDTEKRDVFGIIDANSTRQDTSSPTFEKKCEINTFVALGFQDIKSMDANNVGDSQETRGLSRKECNDVVRKRSSSFDANDDCGRRRSPEKRLKIIQGSFERDGGDYDDDCEKTYSADESKRQRTSEGSFHGEDYDKNTNTDNCESMAKLCLSDQPRANDVEKTNYAHIPPPYSTAAAIGERVEGNGVESPQKTAESKNPGDVSPEQTYPVDGAKFLEKKGGALTAAEWKEILIGRIEQVRESIETEQTPWKTKNKMKVLKKLENQLTWWDEQDEEAFLSRKLQFFQTMRSQYELMKQIGAQRRASTKNTGKKGPELTAKTKVLTVANVNKEKKKSKVAKKQLSKVAKKKTGTSTGKKRGRPPLKKPKDAEA